MRQQLTDRIDTARRRLERTTRDNALGRVARLDIRGRWEETPVWRHDVASALIEKITITHGAARHPVRSVRIDVEWRV